VDLRQLEILVKVAELGSFSRAADALFLTQPTVSEHIRTLEDLRVTRSFHLATHKERSRSPLAEAFRAFVEAEAV